MIRFSKYIWLYFIISAIILIPGIYTLIRFGLRPSVDFTGGTMVEMKFTKPVEKTIVETSAVSNNVSIVSIQPTGSSSLIIRLKPTDDALVLSFQKSIADAIGEQPEILRNETVGPVLGAELMQKAVTASFFAILAILLYVAYAFRNIKFGVSAVIALVHDVLVVLGCFALFGYFLGVEVDTLFVTAFLTTMSFSVHDTIVIFDRIREYRRRDTRSPFEDVCDVALTETMGRSLINSFTIIFMLLALVLMGGSTTQWFAVALLVGSITGTYSSPFVATPVLIVWNRWEKRKTVKN